MAVAALIHAAHNDAQSNVQTSTMMAPANTAMAIHTGEESAAESTAMPSQEQHCDTDAADAVAMAHHDKATTSADCCTFDCDCCVGSCQSVMAVLDLPFSLTVSHQATFFYAASSPNSPRQNLLRPPISA